VCSWSTSANNAGTRGVSAWNERESSRGTPDLEPLQPFGGHEQPLLSRLFENDRCREHLKGRSVLGELNSVPRLHSVLCMDPGPVQVAPVRRPITKDEFSSSKADLRVLSTHVPMRDRDVVPGTPSHRDSPALSERLYASVQPRFLNLAKLCLGFGAVSTFGIRQLSDDPLQLLVEKVI
jgi:hypothetical protein